MHPTSFSGTIRQAARTACLTGSFLFFFSFPVAAQQAVVLSAGGARGLAHVGVLVGLDSLRYNPDIIIGSSMGAVVGALYAAGYSADSIWKLASNQDWRDLFKPMPFVLGPQRAVRVASLHWGINPDEIEFSRGFLPDWRVNRTLVRLLFDAGARSGGDFDRLARRYRAVAADLETGAPFVLERGDLARAVRASMAEPGFFTPIKVGERILIDGGIADYLPVGVARQLGGRPIIAVDVFRPPSSLEGTDPISLVDRAVALLVVGARADTTRPDYLVIPDIKPDQRSFAYPERIEPLIQLGLQATLRTVPRSNELRAERRPLPAAPDSFATLVIESTDNALAALARAAFRNAAPARYSVHEVLAAVDRVYASGFTEGVWPRVEMQPDTIVATNASATNWTTQHVMRASLVVRIDPRPSAAVDLVAGYDNDRGGRFVTAFQRRTELSGAPGEFEISGSASEFHRWAMFSVRRAALSIPPLVVGAAGYAVQNDARFVPVDDDFSEQRVERVGGWLSVDYRHVFPDRVIAAAWYAERIRIEEQDVGTSFGPFLRFTIPEPATQLVGVPTELEGEWRLGDVRYTRAAARASLRGAVGLFRLAAVGDVAATGENAPPDVLPALGDNRAMPAFRWGEGRGRVRVVSGIDVAHPIPFSGHLRLRLRAGSAVEEFARLDRSASWMTAAELGAIWSLPFAPIFFGAGINSRGDTRIDLVLGPQF